jgi:hypothetical protein
MFEERRRGNDLFAVAAPGAARLARQEMLGDTVLGHLNPAPAAAKVKRRRQFYLPEWLLPTGDDGFTVQSFSLSHWFLLTKRRASPRQKSRNFPASGFPGQRLIRLLEQPGLPGHLVE